MRSLEWYHISRDAETPKIWYNKKKQMEGQDGKEQELQQRIQGTGVKTVR